MYDREPLTRRYPYWRVMLAAGALTVIVCLLAGAGVANAAPQPRDWEDGGSSICIKKLDGGWMCF